MKQNCPDKTHPPIARIAAILPDSIAEALGLQADDILCAVNSQPLTDYIAYRFAIAEEEVTLIIRRSDEEVEFEIEKDADEDLGIVFAEDVFDGVRGCRNNCVFCFENQMPTGMRPSLNLRDDDFRLSFLHGNFLTLTNLRDDDLSRIFREHLSPLFVSIHATDLAVRRRMLRNKNAPDICRQLATLSEGGIELHGQIVLCPGWNDGPVLQCTLSDLLALYPALSSVGIVPVGLTAYRPAGPEVRVVSAEDAASVLDLLEKVQQQALAAHGTRLVYAADEFYLLANRPLPPAEAYEDFAQQENGIGLARLFLDEVAELDFTGLARQDGQLHTLLTGVLATPLLRQLALRITLELGGAVQVIAVENQFYGGGVSVAGLLTGLDILHALTNVELGASVFLPAVLLNSDGVFLDDMTPEALEQALGVPLHFCAGPEAVVELLGTPIS